MNDGMVILIVLAVCLLSLILISMGEKVWSDVGVGAGFDAGYQVGRTQLRAGAAG